jgi:toxin ParE1/3/4
VTALRVRPQADQDVDGITEYYAREANVDVAIRFLTALEETYDRLRRHPLSGTTVDVVAARLVGLRFVFVRDFESYLVFYMGSEAVVDVVRVLHGARDLPHLLDDDTDL